MIIQSKNVYIDSKLKKAQIEIKNNKIVGVYSYNAKKVDKDYGNKKIVPGFYDIHTHGYHGYDTMQPKLNGLINWAKYLPKEGVCGFCPTTLTQSYNSLLKALKNVANAKKTNIEGAEILGVHFEGPYINKKYKGAQPEKYIVKPSITEFKQYQKAANGLIKIITLAPECDDNFKLTKYCSKNNINVSIGHTDSTYEIAMKAIKNGAKGFTHTYNAMRPFGHRENGTVGASLLSKKTYSEIIGDGNHSTIEALKLFFDNKADKAILISDSLICKGYKAGDKFNFGGQKIEIYKDGSAHLITGNKQLAGSTLKINEGIKLLIEKVGVPFNVAIDAASVNPCKYLKIDKKKGYIKKGYDADLVVLNDNYSVYQTYCKGIAQI